MSAHDDHGNTPAAWTTAIIVLIGCIISTIGFLPMNLPLIYIGFGVVLLGCVAGAVVHTVSKNKEQAANR